MLERLHETRIAELITRVDTMDKEIKRLREEVASLWRDKIPIPAMINAEIDGVACVVYTPNHYSSSKWLLAEGEGWTKTLSVAEFLQILTENLKRTLTAKQETLSFYEDLLWATKAMVALRSVGV